MNIDKFAYKVNLDTPTRVLEYFNEVFESTLEVTIRFYSVHHCLTRDIVENKKTLLYLDYYNLTLLSLRKLIEPKMKRKFKADKETGHIDLPKIDYQLNFLQWINKYYKNFNSKKIEKDVFNDNNIKSIKVAANKLKESLQEFERIINDKEKKEEGINITHSLNSRVFNYASKFVAHSIANSTVERWEYNNEVFVYDHELLELVKLISRIEDNYKNLTYYWYNVVKMPEKDYTEKFELKIKRHYYNFLDEIKNIYTLESDFISQIDKM